MRVSASSQAGTSKGEWLFRGPISVLDRNEVDYAKHLKKLWIFPLAVAAYTSVN